MISETTRTDTESGSALYKGIAHDLHTRIAAGALAPGVRLPSINALCQEYGVSSITVRAALRELVSEGALESRPRSGVFVRERTPKSETKQSVGFLRNSIAVLSQLPLEPDASRPHSWSWDIGLGASRAIREAGKHAFALHPDRFAGEEITRLADEQPIGVVFTELHPQNDRALKVARALKRRGVPVVVYGGAPELAAFDRVVSDHEEGSYELTRFMIAQGRRRILNVWTAPASGYWYARRRAGYERALAESGIEPLPDLVVPPFHMEKGTREGFEAGVRQMAAYLIEHFSAKRPVDALLMSTDIDALAATAACRLFDKEPNQDVLVAGYDNCWRDCALREFSPALPLVTIDKRDEEMGRELISMLLDRVEGRLPSGPQCRIRPPRLMPIKEGGL
jgi:DNA-binding LacI/PurR family transcriptional regulator